METISVNHPCRRRKMEFPHDVLFYNILPRLPMRYVIRCWTVSKQWHSILKSSMLFAKMHLDRVTKKDRNNHTKFLMIRRQGPRKFTTINCETLDVGACHAFPFKFGFRRIQVLSSCNGLILVVLDRRIDNTRVSDIILWNPLTGDYKSMSKTNSNMVFYDIDKEAFKLYYNSWEDDYKVLYVTCRLHVCIYSLKFDSWKKIDSKVAFQGMPNFVSSGWLPSISLNENIYLSTHTTRTTCPIPGGPVYLSRRSNKYIVIRFDTKTEMFMELATPLVKNRVCLGLTVQRCRIYLCLKSTEGHFELWRMNIHGDWMKVSAYSCRVDRFQQPLHLMRNGNWLIKSKTNGILYEVDMKKKKKKRRKHKMRKYILDGFCVEERYMETFVPPNQYID